MIEDYVRQAIVTDVHDGDTITVEVDLGYRTYVKVPLRFNRINAPELRTADGKLAKQFLLKHVKPGDTITVKTYKNPTDKYGRWLADIFVGDTDINDLMVTSGHAVYFNV